MREDTFSLISSLEANYLNIELQEPVRLDEIAVHVIKEDCPDFLIPFRILNINNRVTLKYKLINTIALEYSDRHLYKQEFVRLYLNLLTPFIKGKDWFLDYHYFCIDSRYIYIDKMNSNVCFIYIPEKSYRNTDEEILRFFQKTFTSITISDDAGFQVRLYQYFSGREITLSDLYGMLLQEIQNAGIEKRHIAAPASASDDEYCAAPIPASAPKPILPVAPAETQEKKVSGHKFPFQAERKPASDKKEQAELASEAVLDSTGDSEAVVEALFGSGKKKKETAKKPVEEKNKKKKEGGFSLFGKKKQEVSMSDSPLSTPAWPPVPSPVSSGNSSQAFGGFVSGSGEGDDRTEIFSVDLPAAAAYMELVESPIPGAIPRISLDFVDSFIIIGRMSSDEVQPDVAFSRDFSRIGRRHARIENKDGMFYVIDLGSANHTILNEQTLIPNQSYQLTDGSIITFTNSKPVRYRVHL